MNTVITTHSFEETQKKGEEFVQEIVDTNILALHGDLGSGKTTFVQGLAKGLGIERRIISPTFIIMRTYEVTRHRSFKRLYHVDLYRIEDEKDVEGLGLLELMQDKENLVVIEWPKKIENLLDEKRKDLYFTYSADDKREIRIL